MKEAPALKPKPKFREKTPLGAAKGLNAGICRHSPNLYTLG